jgi:hypothetical protein
MQLPSEAEVERMYILIRHKVRDFSQWKEEYDSHFLERAKAGLAEKHLFTSAADPHEVIILFEAREPDTSKILARSHELREILLMSGIIDHPDIYFLEDHSGMAVMDEIDELVRIENIAADRPDREVAVDFPTSPLVQRTFSFPVRSITGI